MRSKGLVKRAEEKCAWHEEWAPPPAPAPGEELTFAQAFDEYRREWLIPQGKKTSGDESRMRRNLGGLWQAKLGDLTPQVLNRLIVDLVGQGYSTESVRHSLNLVRRVVKRMILTGRFKGPDPFGIVKLPRVSNARERFLSPVEARRLLGALQARDERMYGMALVGLHCGLRFSEIANLRFCDLDIANMRLFVPQSKNGRSRFAVLTPLAARVLASREPKGPSGLLFAGLRGQALSCVPKVFFRVVDELGLNRIGDREVTDRRLRVVFHTLRHTYASWLVQGGQSIIVLSDRMGHASIETTMRYAHVGDESRKETARIISSVFGG